MSEQLVGIILDIGYLAIFVAALGSILFPLIQLFSDVKKLIRTGVSLAILAVIYGICYALADGTVTQEYMKLGINEGTSRYVGASLNMMFVLLGISVLAIIFSEVSKAFK